MKNLILKSTMFLGAAVLMGLSAQAQSINVTIPFAFEANGKSMPAGDYKVTTTSENAGGIYAMRNVDSHDGVLLTGKFSLANSDGPAKLVFQQTGDGYYLTEVWNGLIGRAVQSPRSRNSVLASTKPATRVVIAAKN